MLKEVVPISTQNEHLKKLHDESILVDAHFDLLMDVQDRREQGERHVIEKEHLDNFRRGGIDVIVSSIFICNKYLPEMGLRRALGQISALHAEMDECQGKFVLCRSYDDILQAKKSGQLAILLSLEGADPLMNDIGLLRTFYDLGVRGVGLVWSRRNYAADGCFFRSVRQGKKGGLTDFGVNVVETAEKLGMFIDVSHLNDEGFWDVMEISEQPVIASHSNCRSVASSMRNLTDDQIKALASKNGVIGMNACSGFCSDSEKPITVSELVDHVDHITDLVGVRHIGMGFDFCDSFGHFSGSTNHDVIEGHGHIANFTEELLKRGYSDEDIRAILGENWMSTFRSILK